MAPAIWTLNIKLPKSVCLISTDNLFFKIPFYCFFGKFERQSGERNPDNDIWTAYCAFHLGDYKQAMEVIKIKLLFFEKSVI